LEIFVDIRYISSLKTINPVCCECHAHYKKSCCAENYTYECAATWKKSSCVLRFIHYRINSSSAFLHSCAVQAQQRVIIIFSTSIKINKNQSRVRMSACAVSSHFTHDHLSLSLLQSAFSDSNVLLAAAQNRHDSHQIFRCERVLNNHRARIMQSFI